MPIFNFSSAISKHIATWVGCSLFLAACSRLPNSDKDNGGLILPDGFGAVVVVDSIGSARHFAVNDNGDIYVKRRTYKEDEGSLALRDVNGDGKADTIKKFGGYPSKGYGSTEMRIHNGYLYFSTDLVLYRQKLTPGKLIPEAAPEIVLTDDHAHGSHWHITKPVAFDNKGNMYVPFGAPTNACQDLFNNTPGGTAGVPGQDPCPELIQHGGIWKFDANKIGLTQKDGVRFATGIRSVVGIAWNEEQNSLYLVQHGRDDLHLLWPDEYTPWKSAILPAEELLKINEGDDFGWPYSYYDQTQGKNVLAPEYGGDGKKDPRTKVALPAMGFPAHWAPNDILFYKGNQFPERYKHGAFIAFHGSTNRAPYPQAGYFICFVPFENGKPNGQWEVFANGFANADPIVNVSDAKYRPMGLSEGPDGSLYIIESEKGKIWRIMFKADKQQYGKAQLNKMELEKNKSNLRTPDEINDNLYKEKVRPGAQIYNFYCRSCHQGNWKGDENRFPPLAGSDWVTGDTKRLLNVILNGLTGPLTMNEKSYNNIMPKHDFLKDEDVVELVNFIRTHFGNNASNINIQQVQAIRKAHK